MPIIGWCYSARPRPRARADARTPRTSPVRCTPHEHGRASRIIRIRAARAANTAHNAIDELTTDDRAVSSSPARRPIRNFLHSSILSSISYRPSGQSQYICLPFVAQLPPAVYNALTIRCWTHYATPDGSSILSANHLCPGAAITGDQKAIPRRHPTLSGWAITTRRSTTTPNSCRGVQRRAYLATRRPDQHVPLAGVPYHTVDIYVAKLNQRRLQSRHRRAEIGNEPPKGEKLRPTREVRRVVTPGTLVNRAC